MSEHTGTSWLLLMVKYLLAFAVGVVPGFFGVFNSLFSDGPAGERVGFMLIITIVYFALATIIGLVDPHDARSDVLAFALPAIGFAALLIVSGEVQMLVWAVGVVALVLLASFNGADTGAWLRERRGHHRSAHHHGAHPA